MVEVNGKAKIDNLVNKRYRLAEASMRIKLETQWHSTRLGTTQRVPFKIMFTLTKLAKNISCNQTH